MTLSFNVEKADLTLESAFVQPEFGLFRGTPGLVKHLFTRLEPHGLRLQDMKIERAVLVVPQWRGNFLGYGGLLQHIRFAIDAAHNLFYFGKD